MIRNILFDMGGVLVDLDIHACMRAFLDLSANRDETRKTISAGEFLGDGGTTSLHDFELGNLTVDQYIDTLMPACRPGTTRQQVLDATCIILAGIPAARRQAILDLRAKGYRVYLLSNINDLHWEVCRRMMESPMPDADGNPVSHPLSDFFHEVFLSQRLHLCKPDPRIYDAVISSTGILPAETLYIDDVEANILAGRAAGFTSLQATGNAWLPAVAELPSLI